MTLTIRSKDRFLLDVHGHTHEVQRYEYPFREGVELVTTINGKEIRVSDRGLGDHEAVRLLRIEIEGMQ